MALVEVEAGVASSYHRVTVSEANPRAAAAAAAAVWVAEVVEVVAVEARVALNHRVTSFEVCL